MKTFTDAAQSALERGDAIASAMIAIYGPTPIFVWGGLAYLTFAGDTGDETYSPLGDKSFAQLTTGSVGGTAENVTVTLSGVDPAALEVLDATEVKRAPCVVRRLVFDNSGRTMLDSYVFTRGRIDQVFPNEIVGGQAAIQVMIETSALGLGRNGGRMRSDADQRLINSTDGFFKNVSYAAQKTLYWGGKRPSTAGDVLTAGTPTGFGFNRFGGRSVPPARA